MVEEIKGKLGLRLQELRVRNNVTQKQLACRVGVSESYISSIEQGRRFLEKGCLDKIVSGLELETAIKTELIALFISELVFLKIPLKNESLKTKKAAFAFVYGTQDL